MEIAELAVRHGTRAVGYDIAGPEAGYPPTRHLDAFHLIARENFHFTIHAGEGFCRASGRRCSGAAPSGSATVCGSRTSPPGPDGRVVLAGRLRRDRRVPLETCPTSNAHTGAVS